MGDIEEYTATHLTTKPTVALIMETRLGALRQKRLSESQSRPFFCDITITLTGKKYHLLQ